MGLIWSSLTVASCRKTLFTGFTSFSSLLQLLCDLAKASIFLSVLRKLLSTKNGPCGIFSLKFIDQLAWF